MSKKLTLSVDENLINFAHHYSKRTHQSISHLFEKYLQHLKYELEEEKLSNETKELYGIMEKENLPDKKMMRKYLYEKSIN